tara:strand:- start:782 stop:2089 length:1308 start_codon:yes stop_codon:yes gene_type:complete
MFYALDIETTGLPATRRANFKNLKAYDNCRVVSVALVEFGSDGNEVHNYHEIVKPTDFTVGATEIHGITHDRALEQGIDFEMIFLVLSGLYYADNDTVFIGHNLEFDISVLKSEAFRGGLDWEVMDDIKTACTFKLAKTYYNKPMKLMVLYNKLFEKDFANAHDALADARAAGEIYAVIRNDPRKTSPINTKKVYIKASDVASAIGSNYYKPSQEVLENLWQKYAPDTFTGKTVLDKCYEALEFSDEAKDTINKAIVQTPSSSDDAADIFEKSKIAINKSDQLTPNQKELVVNLLRMLVYTNYGTNHEDKTADKFENLQKDETFYKIPIITIADTTYIVCGRIDRIETTPNGQKILVEIKNRVSKLFGEVRAYEMIQVQTYMKMTDLEAGKLIEQYNDEVKTYQITKSDKLWDTKIQPRLESFCKTLHSYMTGDF